MTAPRDTLMLLHPFPMDASFWGPVWRALGRDVELVTPEFPGFGAEPAAGSPTIDGVADTIAGRIRGAGTGPVVVCGLSLGGYLALSLAVRHPDTVGALVLANTRAEDDTDEARRGRDRAVDTIRIDGLQAWLADFLPRLLRPDPDVAAFEAADAIASRQDPDAVCAALEALRDRPSRVADLPGIRVPTLLIGGAQDRTTPAEAGDVLEAGIPDTRRVVIPGAGHLSALEQPQVFADALGRFVDART